MVAPGKVHYEQHHPDRGQARPNAAARPDHVLPPIEEGHCRREPADRFRPARRLDRPGPLLLDGWVGLDAAEIVLPVSERYCHGLQLAIIFPAIRARREMVFNRVPLRCRQCAAGQKTEVPTITPAWIKKPFHVCLSPVTSERFIFILRNFSRA